MFLTKSAKSMLYTLYKEYTDRRKRGLSKFDSANFDCAQSVHDNFFPSFPLQDVEDSLLELGENDFLVNLRADGTVYSCFLSDYAISTMESHSKETFLSVTDFISKFIP